MADNAISFRRFASLPNNISEDGGLSLEEIKLNRGAPPKNPVAAPMAAPRASRRRLALNRAGSDDMRLTGPSEPEQDPYEGPASVLGLLRSGSKKLANPILGELSQVVATLPQADLKANMQGSFAAIAQLSEQIGALQEMGDFIFVRMLGANSK